MANLVPGGLDRVHQDHDNITQDSTIPTTKRPERGNDKPAHGKAANGSVALGIEVPT